MIGWFGRQGVRVGLIGVLGVGGVLGGGVVPAFAEESSEQIYEVGVVNYAGSDVKVRFFYSGASGQVWSVDKTGAEFFGAKKLPTMEAVRVGSGAASPAYAYQVPNEAYDVGYWLEVTRGDDVADRSVAKTYRWSPGEKPPVIVDSSGSSLKIEARYEPRRGGFTKEKTVFVVSDNRAHVDTPSVGASSPYPGVWDRDVRVGIDDGGWARLDDSLTQWQMRGLSPSADYWMRCYDQGFSQVAFNGYFPQQSDLGGGIVDGQGAGFWVTSNDQGVVSVLRPSGASVNDGTCDVHRTENSVTAKRITGAATKNGVNERPIYRVDIAAQTRVFDSALPDQFRIPSFLIEGVDASGQWRTIGTVLPSTSVQKPDGKNEARLGGTDFLFQNKVGENIQRLRVSGGFSTASNEIVLNDLNAPTITAKQINNGNGNNREFVGPATVEANGVMQREILPTLTDSTGAVITDQSPLAEAYDLIYFRDENGRLITNMYSETGSTVISRYKTSSLTDTPSTRNIFLSTTDRNAGLTSVFGNIELDEHIAGGPLPAEAKVSFYAKQYAVSGSVASGVSVNDGFARTPTSTQPFAPVYRTNTTTPNPATVAVLNYRTLVSADELPRDSINNDHLGNVTLTNNTLGQLQHLGINPDLEKLDYVSITGVTKTGTSIGLTPTRVKN